MKYFLDSEFVEDGSTIDLLSIGIVAEDGREIYQCNREAKLNNATDWVIWNVFPHLGVSHAGMGWHWNEGVRQDNTMRPDLRAVVVPRSEIRDRIRRFVGDDPKPSFYGYYADYDWVVLCQLFGRMVDLPDGWPMYCIDLKQICNELGDIRLPKQKSVEHNALEDARWVKQSYAYLKDILRERDMEGMTI